jgi:hypothetical protein
MKGIEYDIIYERIIMKGNMREDEVVVDKQKR